MNDSTRVGELILGMSLIAGVAGDYLLRAEPGINVLLWFGLVLSMLAVLTRAGGVTLKGEGRWLAVPAVFLAGAFAWRNSPMLLVVDALILAFTMALAVMRTRHGGLRQGGVAEYLLAAFAGGVNVVAGPLILVFGDISWKEIPGRGWSRTAPAVVRGLLVALPLLLVFGALFASADVVFRKYLTYLYFFGMDEFLVHVLVGAWFAWVAAGIMRTVAWANEPDWESFDSSISGISLGRVELVTILGSLNLLFLAFVAVQFRYLFGGVAMVEVTAGLTYAEYARRGFFELVAVAALVLPLLLFVDWLVRGEDERGRRLFRWLAGSLVLQLFVVMGSALHRMHLYQQEFGQTELRFYVTAFIIWLAAIFVWFLLTVLREYRRHFLSGALLAGYLALLVLHVINPDAYVSASNLAHFKETGKYDAHYNMSLSDDAVPVLVRSISELPEQQARHVADWVLRRWDPERSDDSRDWRSWNLGRWRAWQAVEENRELLESLAEGVRND